MTGLRRILGRAALACTMMAWLGGCPQDNTEQPDSGPHVDAGPDSGVCLPLPTDSDHDTISDGVVVVGQGDGTALGAPPLRSGRETRLRPCPAQGVSRP